jgi:hypothetical protein
MAATEDNRKNGEIASVLPLGTKIMSKYEKTGATATESVSEPVMGTESVTKEELPVYQEITGLITAIKQIEAPVLAFKETVHNVATAQEKTAKFNSELLKEKDNILVQTIIAATGFKPESIGNSIEATAKKAVNVQVAATRQILKNIAAAVDAIEAKYGTVPVKPAVPTPKSKSTGLGNITADNTADIEDMLKSRGYEEIAFELQSDGTHYRVYATKPGNKPRDTLFSSNVTRDWL